MSVSDQDTKINPEKTKIKKVRPRKKFELYNFIVSFVLGFFALIIILPFYYVIIISITSEAEFIRTPLLIFPTEPTLDAYRALFADGRIFIGYGATLRILAIGLPVNMILTTLLAYALSRPAFPGKKFFIFYALFTMFFSGGIIPLYLLIVELGIINTIWSVVLASGINTFYFILMRNYFMALPPSLEESAKIDGAHELRVLISIILPISKPILATITLFYAVDRWNEWFNALVFIRRMDLTPLQLILRAMVMEAMIQDPAATAAIDDIVVQFALGMRMAAVFLTMLPVMLVYPFLQKYFTKGIMIGAIKA